MSTFNDLVNVTFEDAVTYSTTDTSDILGVIMPYHWGPVGKINVFNKQEFYDAYPEIIPSFSATQKVTITEATYRTYYQIKSFFNNGGSRVAVYRPSNSSEFYIGDNGNHIGLKYPGYPCDMPIGTTAIRVQCNITAGVGDVAFQYTTDGTNWTSIESFSGQTNDPAVVDPETGESTYIPYILEQKSRYMKHFDDATINLQADGIFVAQSSSLSLAEVFGLTEDLIPTMFISYDAAIDGYTSSTFFIATETPSTPPSPTSRFKIDVAGKESIQVFKTNHTIYCNAGVAGAYSNIARQTHLNQIASARAYGSYVGTLTTTYRFQEVNENMKNGVVTVYNAANGPQIFGTRNSFNRGHSSSYFARCNVSRVLASILKNIIGLTYDVIHTDTAANAVSRKMFETNLNNILGQYISTQDIQADSIAICNSTNNSDPQTQGGTILNIILALHFIGLVEKVNIRVIATDSSVTVNFV